MSFIWQESGGQQVWLCLLTLLVVPLSTVPLELQRRIINDAFARLPQLRGQSWVRAKRPPISVVGNQKVNLPALVDKLTSTDVKLRREGANGLALLGPVIALLAIRRRVVRITAG